MLPLTPSFVICPAAEVLPAGLTLPLLAVLSWSLVGRPAKLGALPGGTVVHGPLARGRVQSGLPCTLGLA